MIYMTYLEFVSFPLGKDDFRSIELRSHGFQLIDGSCQKNYTFLTIVGCIGHKYKVSSSKDVIWRTCTMSEWTKSNETKSKIQTQYCKPLNPRGSVSLILPCWSGEPMRKQGDSILLTIFSRQVALANAQGDIGWKLNILTFCLL